MPTLLSDPPASVYLVLGGVAVVALLLWLGRRDRKSLAVFLAAAVLVALVFVLDGLFESPREESERRVIDMARAADAKHPDAFVAHLADTVELYGDGGQARRMTRDAIKNSPFWSQMRQFNVRVTASGFSRSEVKEVGPDGVEIGFIGKGEVDGKPIPFFIRATFTRQPDGQLKLTVLRAFDPIDHNKPVTIPGLTGGL